MKAMLALFLVGAASTGSMCQKSSGTADATKDPTPVVDVNLAQVDTTSLTPREKREWSTYVSELLAPCADTPVPIAQCVKEKRSCNKCLPAAKLMEKAVRDGYSREQVEKSFHNRFDADKIKNVTVEGSPYRGPSSAPVTVVEFADFECPHCQMMAPILDKLWSDHQTQIRFVYKFLPLSGHLHAEPAARAAYAAFVQGKFWEMHHKLFEAQGRLEQSDLEGYAKEIGLDMAKFHADMQSQAATDRIATDRKLADALEVQGTPTIYINGREFDPKCQTLDDWIDLELELEGVKQANGPVAPPPAASGSASAAPSASASAAPRK